MYTRLVLLSSAREKPSSWLIVESSGLVVGRGALAPDSPATPFKGRTILVVPGTGVATRWLKLENGPARPIVEAAAAVLKDEIGAPRASIHIALGNVEDDGARPVSVIDRRLMREFLDHAAALGISPDIVVPDHLMLPAPSDGVLAVARDDIMIVRGRRVAFSAETELALMLIGSRRRTSIESEEGVELLFAEGSQSVEMNVLQQDFAAAGRREAWGRLRRAAALATIAALSPLAIWTAEIVRNEVSARALEARAQETARTLLGNEESVDPIRELHSRAAALRANDAFMHSTRALFEAMSRIGGMELENLTYLDEGITRATLVHAVLFNVSALSDALQQSGIAVDQDAAQQRDGRTLTTITLKSQS
jgi:general secretion pathway protein L